MDLSEEVTDGVAFFGRMLKSHVADLPFAFDMSFILQTIYLYLLFIKDVRLKINKTFIHSFIHSFSTLS